MQHIIYYFTRTGVSEKTAKALGMSKAAPVYAITDGHSWKGLFGFIKALFYSFRKLVLPAVYRVPEEGEEIILVSPLWMGQLPPAVKTFISQVGREKISLYVTSWFTVLKDRDGYIRVTDLVGKDIFLPEEPQF